MIDLQELGTALTSASVMMNMIKDFEADLSHLDAKIVFDYSPKNKVYIYKRYSLVNLKLSCIGVGSSIFVAWANRIFKNDDDTKFEDLKKRYEDVMDISNARIEIK